MLYFNVTDTDATPVNPYAADGTRELTAQSRHDWKTFDAAKTVAALANKTADCQRFLAIDNGQYVSPRFDIVEIPQVGDEVSYAFNGDGYPDGEITAVSKTLKVITTSTGNRYYRVADKGAWKRAGTWSLVKGHRSTKNPSF